MQIAVVGVSHHSTPVEVRERFVMGSADAEPALAALLEVAGVREAVVLSTCNRTELYLVGGAEVAESGARYLLERAGLGEAGREYIYVSRSVAAVEHVFRVASGLDSMVVGEAQIQGQVRSAYECAQRATTVGPILARLLERALSVGALVRSETGIGQRAGTVATGVLEVAKKVFGVLQDKRAVVVGAGEMSQLVLEVLVSQKARCTVVASRSETGAHGLAMRMGIDFARMDELPRLLRGAELLVSATGAPHAVVGHELVEAAVDGRRGRPLLAVDLALPRDIAPSVGELENVFLFDMDDLRPVVERRESWWHRELQRAEGMVQAAITEYHDWYRSRSAVPIIRSLRTWAEEVRQAEVERTLRRLPHLTDADREAVEKLTMQLVNKVLHGPMVRLRDAARSDDGGGTEMLEAAQYLFQIQLEEDVADTDWEEESGAA